MNITRYFPSDTERCINSFQDRNAVFLRLYVSIQITASRFICSSALLLIKKNLNR